MTTYKNLTFKTNEEYQQIKRNDPESTTEFIECEFKQLLNSEDKFNVFTNCKFTKPVDILPTEGSFIAWKKVRGTREKDYVLKLLVPTNAKRVTPYVENNRKCRVSQVKVLQAYSVNTGRVVKSTKFCSAWDCNFLYEVGQLSKEPEFDSSRTKICTQGIHVLLTKQEAMDYCL